MAEYPPKRHRLALSCIECRQRKVRCDRNSPCHRCIGSKRVCHYRTRPGAVSTAYSANNDTPPASIGSHQDFADSTQTDIATRPMDDEILNPRQDEILNQQLTQPRLQTGQDNAPGFIMTDDQGLPLVWEQQGHERLQSKDETTGRIPSLGATDQDQSAALAGKQIIPTNFHRAIIKGCYFGRSHWMTTGQELRRMKEFLYGQTPISEGLTSIEPVKEEISKLFHECKCVAKLRKSSRPSRNMTHNQLSASPPPRDVADKLAYLYTSRFESVFRILHIPSFWQEYEHYWQTPGVVTMVSQLKILLVLAIGSSMYQASNEHEVRAKAREHVYAAQAFLFNDVEKSYHNVESVQVQCLLLLARQTLDVGGDLIWSLMGLVAHSAIQVGLHRDPEHFKRFSTLQCEIRRRLWATVLEMMMQAALDSGMPLHLDLDDFDTRPPSNVNDHELSEHTQSVISHPCSELTDTSIQILLLEYFPIRLEIVQLLNKPCIKVGYERVLALSSSINKACREARKLDGPDTILDSAVFKYNFTDFLLRRFIAHLHQPFASLAREHAQYHFSRKARLDAALALLAPKPDADFSHLIFGGGGMFKSRIKQCALTVGSELLAEAEEDLDVARSSSRSFRGMLIEVAKDALSEAATRLRFGETSVKLHMTLSMVIARAQCTSPPSSVQLRLAQSVKESLQQSLSILRTFIGPTITCDNSVLPDLYHEQLEEPSFDDGLDFIGFLDSYGVETDLLTYV